MKGYKRGQWELMFCTLQTVTHGIISSLWHRSYYHFSKEEVEPQRSYILLTVTQLRLKLSCKLRWMYKAKCVAWWQLRAYVQGGGWRRYQEWPCRYLGKNFSGRWKNVCKLDRKASFLLSVDSRSEGKASRHEVEGAEWDWRVSGGIWKGIPEITRKLPHNCIWNFSDPRGYFIVLFHILQSLVYFWITFEICDFILPNLLGKELKKKKICEWE